MIAFCFLSTTSLDFFWRAELVFGTTYSGGADAGFLDGSMHDMAALVAHRMKKETKLLTVVHYINNCTAGQT